MQIKRKICEGKEAFSYRFSQKDFRSNFLPCFGKLIEYILVIRTSPATGVVLSWWICCNFESVGRLQRVQEL